jgi:hypothetical protein
MKEHEVEALSRAIEEHVTWLRERGIEIETDAADLTLTETLSLLKRSGEQWNARVARLLTGVLGSLHRLCALRGRVIGIERARDAFERALSKNPKLKEHAAAVGVALDDSHRKLLEPRFVEFEKRATGVLNGLKAFEVTSVRRGVKLARHGYGAVGIPETAHDLACSRWLRMRIDELLGEVALFRSEMAGPVGSQAIGHPGKASSGAWRAVRGECMQLVKDGGGTLGLLQALFDEDRGQSAPEQKKDRTRKRVARAKKRVRSNG